MDYPAAVAYLDSLAQFGWKLDLARIERLCELAGHPERQFPSVLVGGSAGKGSTCAFLASIFQAAGLRVGTAPKPHLLTHRERVQVNGELISEERFAALMERIQPWAAQVTAEEGSPTVFEVMTLLAFLYFAEERVERAVVEVGLGGRFDATNVLTPDLSIITMIGLDHTDRLGETVKEIAFEKAGIIKEGGRVVTGATGAALEVIERVAAERGAAVRSLGRDFDIRNVRFSRQPMYLTQFDLHEGKAVFRDRRINLMGEHQAKNAAVAASAALWLAQDGLLSLGERELFFGLHTADLAGRLQVVRRRPLLLLDGAHSPDRADALARALRSVYRLGSSSRRLILVIGCSAGHAPEVVVARLAPLAAEVIATRSRHPAAAPTEEVAAAARACGVPTREEEPVSAAVEAALADARQEDMVLVTGSLFAVGEALAAFRPS